VKKVDGPLGGAMLGDAGQSGQTGMQKVLPSITFTDLEKREKGGWGSKRH
jgi:hypothetical protein